ncbi:spindle assembly checkpoint component Mad1 [Endogone sp. FLAS-F59071]|nr:spindle assembly checkpoint component Mad1 [Endogone sp. FLAS-F59071]|eukprot:RUS21761.1 spindle assembly checkpoint component Mad1 [Endogone sp. FLAS-F59071]
MLAHSFVHLVPSNLRTDVELSRARKQISDLKFELSTVRTDSERKSTAWDRTKSDMEIQAKELIMKVEVRYHIILTDTQVSRIEMSGRQRCYVSKTMFAPGGVQRLESNIQYLYDREKEASKKLEEVEQENVTIKQESDRLVRQLKDDNRKLKEESAELSEANRHKESEAEQKIKGLQIRLQGFEDSFRQAREQLQQQTQYLAANSDLLLESQRKLAEAEESLRELRGQAADRENVGIISKQLHDQVAHVKSLEKQNRGLNQELKHYKELYQNIEILREQKTSMQSELSRMDQLRHRLGELEVENTLLKKEKKDNTDFDSPYDMAKTLASQRYEIAGLLEKQGILAADVKSRDAYIEKVEGYMQEFKEKYMSLDERYQKELRSMKRLEKSKQLAQKEIGFLREQLKTYDTEETTFMEGNYDIQKAKRIEQLEELLEECKRQLNQAEDHAAAAENDSTKPDNPSNGEGQAVEMMAGSASGKALHSHVAEITKQKEELLETMNNLRKENAILQKEMNSMGHQIGILEEALARGEYNPHTTRVLQLRDNPASGIQAIRESTLEGLKVENKALLDKLQRFQNGTIGNTWDTGPLAKKRRATEELEAVGLGDVDTVPRQSLINLQKENKSLETQIAAKEAREKRFKQIWGAKLTEYREAVHSLLGYKLDFLENGRVRLKSMYSEADDHSFIFTSNDGDMGMMKLAGGGNTEYMNSMQNQIRFWVNERDSIPAFLSSVTLELFDRTTVMSGGIGSRGRNIVEGDRTWLSGSL